MKPPAFQCYADDLLSGTADMTAEEFGVYWRLICHSWNKGGLPNDDRRLALMAGQCSGNAVAHAKTKFRLCEDGLLRNDRLEQVRNEQELYLKNQSDKANLRWKKHRETGKTGATEPHAAALPVDMPEGCSPSPSPSPMDNKREQALPEANVPSWDEVKRMAEMQAIPEKTARAEWLSSRLSAPDLLAFREYDLKLAQALTDLIYEEHAKLAALDPEKELARELAEECKL